MARAGLSFLAAVAMALSPAAAAAKGPRVTSDEYKKSWGLEAIGARSAYDAGLTGKGITVAMVDCGIAKAQNDVMRNLSRRSKDVVEGRAMPVMDRHGSYMAGPLASALPGWQRSAARRGRKGSRHASNGCDSRSTGRRTRTTRGSSSRTARAGIARRASSWRCCRTPARLPRR